MKKARSFLSRLFLNHFSGDTLFKQSNKSCGFTLFDIVAIVAIMGLVFAFGAPKYLECIRNTHNSNINIMVGTIKIWSVKHAINSFNKEGKGRYPLPSSTTIKNVIEDGQLTKWDDSDSSNWKYLAGGGIDIEGDGTYFVAKPIYIN